MTSMSMSLDETESASTVPSIGNMPSIFPQVLKHSCLTECSHVSYWVLHARPFREVQVPQRLVVRSIIQLCAFVIGSVSLLFADIAVPKLHIRMDDDIILLKRHGRDIFFLAKKLCVCVCCFRIWSCQCVQSKLQIRGILLWCVPNSRYFKHLVARSPECTSCTAFYALQEAS